jgi:hypothetical protein
MGRSKCRRVERVKQNQFGHNTFELLRELLKIQSSPKCLTGGPIRYGQKQPVRNVQQDAAEG